MYGITEVKPSFVSYNTYVRIINRLGRKKSGIEMWCCLAASDRGLGRMMNVVEYKHKPTALNVEQRECTLYLELIL